MCAADYAQRRSHESKGMPLGQEFEILALCVLCSQVSLHRFAAPEIAIRNWGLTSQRMCATIMSLRAVLDCYPKSHFGEPRSPGRSHVSARTSVSR